MRAIVVCAVAAMIAAAYPALTLAAQDKAKEEKISEGEQKALAKIQAAPDTAAKIQAASEFAKKYPKSPRRKEIASFLASEIAKGPDAAQQITQLETLLAAFKEPAESDAITPLLIDAYVKANRVDDAFKAAGSALSKNPNDLVVLTQATIVGVDQAKQQNAKYVQQAQQYGGKAIELIETDKRPAGMDDARWGDYKTRMLPQLYQATGMLAMMTGNKDEAKTKLEKAVSLNASDPFPYVLLGSMINDEYQDVAKKHGAQTPGPLKDELLKQAHAKLDQVIDMFARGVALSEGRPEYQQLHDQILQDLQSYYRYRHGGSTTGLQALIDKYKKQ